MLPQQRYPIFYFIGSAIIAVCILYASIILSSKNDEKHFSTITFIERQFTANESLAKLATLLEKTPLAHPKFKSYQQQLDSVWQMCQKIHVGLRNGNDSLMIEALQNPSIVSLFHKIHPSFASMGLSITQINNIQNLHSDTVAQKKALSFHVQNLLKHQEEFLSLMEEVSFLHKKEVKLHGEEVRRNSVILTSISLAVLLLITLFIFLPLSKIVFKRNKEFALKDETIVQLKNHYEEQSKELIQVREELKSTQEELERTKLELSGIVHSINFSLLYAEYDLEGKLLDANDAYIQALKLKPNEYYDKKHDELVDKDWAQSYQLAKIWKKLVKGVSFAGEICYHISEETIAWLYATFTPVKSTKGNFYKIIVIAYDITKIKNDLHDYKIFTQLLEENKLFAIFDLDTNFVDANEIFLRHFEYSKEELVTLKHEAILPEKESIATVHEAFWQNVLQKGSSPKKCFERISSKGKSVWVDGSYIVTPNYKNKPSKVVLIGEVVFIGEIEPS